jgi:hypothetical protein
MYITLFLALFVFKFHFASCFLSCYQKLVFFKTRLSFVIEPNLSKQNNIFICVKMGFSEEHKTFMIESCIRNGQQTKLGRCLREFREKFLDIAIDVNASSVMW